MKYFAIVCMLMFMARSIHSQGTLQFSADSVFTTACDGFILIGVIDVYNTSDQDIRVRWKKQRLELPHPIPEFMIAGGIQYLPGQATHAFNLYSGDSTEVYFHVYLDTLFQGDSIIWQVLFYDEDDSVGTSTLLTAILECPQSTAVDPILETGKVQLFPNPFSNTATLITETHADHARIFDLTGRLLRTYDLDGSQLYIERDDLKPGMYLTVLFEKNKQVGLLKTLVSD